MAELPPVLRLQEAASRRASRATKGGTARRAAAAHAQAKAAAMCRRGTRPPWTRYSSRTKGIVQDLLEMEVGQNML